MDKKRVTPISDPNSVLKAELDLPGNFVRPKWVVLISWCLLEVWKELPTLLLPSKGHLCFTVGKTSSCGPIFTHKRYLEHRIPPVLLHSPSSPAPAQAGDPGQTWF